MARGPVPRATLAVSSAPRQARARKCRARTRLFHGGQILIGDERDACQELELFRSTDVRLSQQRPQMRDRGGGLSWMGTRSTRAMKRASGCDGGEKWHKREQLRMAA